VIRAHRKDGNTANTTRRLSATLSKRNQHREGTAVIEKKFFSAFHYGTYHEGHVPSLRRENNRHKHEFLVSQSVIRGRLVNSPIAIPSLHRRSRS
jgi:hypothetical protein